MIKILFVCHGNYIRNIERAFPASASAPFFAVAFILHKLHRSSPPDSYSR